MIILFGQKIIGNISVSEITFANLSQQPQPQISPEMLDVDNPIALLKKLENLEIYLYYLRSILVNIEVYKKTREELCSEAHVHCEAFWNSRAIKVKDLKCKPFC